MAEAAALGLTRDSFPRTLSINVYDINTERAENFAKLFKAQSHTDIRSCVMDADLIFLSCNHLVHFACKIWLIHMLNCRGGGGVGRPEKVFLCCFSCEDQMII